MLYGFLSVLVGCGSGQVGREALVLLSVFHISYEEDFTLL